MLTERRAAILGMVVSEYINTAEPVSSRAIVARHHLDISTATIRTSGSSPPARGAVPKSGFSSSTAACPAWRGR